MHLSVDNPVARLDDCKETGYNKLQYVLDWALENNAVILQAGDVCHKARSWHLLSDLQEIFSPKDKFYCVYGQHDTSMYNEATRKATILGALAGAKIINILNEAPTYIRGHCVYGCHYGQEVPIPKNNKEFNILVIHAPITNEALWEGQDYWDAKAFLIKHSKYKIILCGDIHRKFCVEHDGRYIINTGPMIRREATIYNFQHHPGFWVWDDVLSWQEIPHVPAEQVLTRDHIEYKQEAISILDEFIRAIKMDVSSENKDISFMSNLFAFIRANNLEQDVIDEIAKTVGEEKFYK